MPVIVVGADTPIGRAAVEALLPDAAEVRAFVTDVASIDPLRALGVKVAAGDVSDGSHVGGAALNAFCAVLIEDAALDERERSFAETAEAVVAAWADGLRESSVHRTIWVGRGAIHGVEELLAAATPEFAAVAVGDRRPREIAGDIARLESSREV